MVAISSRKEPRVGQRSGLRYGRAWDHPQCLKAGEHPCKKLKGGGGVGIESGAIYLVFPGTRPVPLLSQTVNSIVEQQAAEKAMTFLRANSQ